NFCFHTANEPNHVDVKLDPATAHQCLLLSDDGKKVKDGGKNQRVPDSPKRFDMFGSILGLNSLTSGKSYWEVDVSNKTGWDLGVARGDANRKGKLLLNPDNGYWVTVHYEDKQYAALTAPPVSLSLRKKAKKVGVFVDYEEGSPDYLACEKAVVAIKYVFPCVLIEHIATHILWDDVSSSVTAFIL
uniref:B30.2/SPRY domain-containing protein n=1 Tax=Lates calcarifer TaxID=8187 RepID=A0A4W6BSS0_LATCA